MDGRLHLTCCCGHEASGSANTCVRADSKCCCDLKITKVRQAGETRNETAPSGSPIVAIVAPAELGYRGPGSQRALRIGVERAPPPSGLPIYIAVSSYLI
jgi:hypothetical protein